MSARVQRQLRAALALAMVGAAVSPAFAVVEPGAEASIDPVDGAFRLEGHGYGHGRGMSQWGAEGAASLGIPYEQILATYYPGTTLAPGSPTAKLRVHITDDYDNDMRVRPAEGLTATANGASFLLPAELADAKVTLWRAS